MLRPYATRNADHYFENLLAIKILKNHSSRQISKSFSGLLIGRKKKFFFNFRELSAYYLQISMFIDKLLLLRSPIFLINSNNVIE